MASLGCDSGGLKRILFLADGKRKTIRLGKVSKRQAETIKIRIEALVAAHITGVAADDEVSKWLTGLPDTLYTKLAAVGLCQPRVNSALGTFLEETFAAMNVKPSTVTMYGHTKRCLLDHFGASRDIRTITTDDALGWRKWLDEHEKLSPATISRRVGVARQFFRRASDRDLIRRNPFAGVRAGNQVNTGRQFFVSREIANRVLNACPSIESKLMFALSRFGGLRCPSEHLLLRWSDIDWVNGRMTVRSPKTEHHEGKDSRVIPIFPELAGLLREASQSDGRDPDYVIASRRDSSCNLRTSFCRIIRKAGLKPWPRLFQNLRSTRQTELANEFPIHVVCAWIGNSVAIARDHYLQLTDDHFRTALGVDQQIHQPRSAA